MSKIRLFQAVAIMMHVTFSLCLFLRGLGGAGAGSGGDCHRNPVFYFRGASQFGVVTFQVLESNRKLAAIALGVSRQYSF